MEQEELLRLQFACCRAFVASSNLFPGASSPAQWLRLQALDLQASSGPCTLSPPPASDIEGRALWRAWCELGSMEPLETLREFVRQVLQLCEALDFETDVLNFLSEFDAIGERIAKVREEPALLPAGPTESIAPRPRASDLKTTIGNLSEELATLSANAREDVRLMALAMQADVTIEERTMDARDSRAQMEELRTEVQQLIKQLDSDIDAALSRRKWSYEQIESQCEELLARCETCANTYKNQRSLTSTRTSKRISYAASLLIPVGAAISYWIYRKKAG